MKAVSRSRARPAAGLCGARGEHEAVSPVFHSFMIGEHEAMRETVCIENAVPDGFLPQQDTQNSMLVDDALSPRHFDESKVALLDTACASCLHSRALPEEPADRS